MFGEGERQSPGELQLLEVVAICDHLGLLCGGELEHEVGRKPAAVTLDLLVEALGRHAVDLGQIGVDHHAQGAHGLDTRLNARHRQGGQDATFRGLKAGPRRGLRARYGGRVPALSPSRRAPTVGGRVESTL